MRPSPSVFLVEKPPLYRLSGETLLHTLIKNELQKHEVDFVDLAPQSELLPTISSVWVNQRGQRNVVSVNATRLPIPKSAG